MKANPRTGLRPLNLAALSAALLLAGCSLTGPAGAGYMGRDARSADRATGGQGHHSRPTCSPPAALPGTTVRVVLADMGMSRVMGGVAPMGARMMLHTSPAAVAVRSVTLVARNIGWRTHELVVLPLEGRSSAGQRVPGSDGKVEESGSLGEASSSCAAGQGEGIASGAAGWVTLSLAPGRYELLCNLKNHYANGMYGELDVR